MIRQVFNHFLTTLLKNFLKNQPPSTNEILISLLTKEAPDA